jgi:hypothetical protein
MATSTNTLALGGQSPDAVYSALTAKGVSELDATKIVGDWIIQNIGGGTRTFGYSAPVSPTESADCTPRFVRSFVHQDWVDGVSTVQAGLTTGEQGFNDRLHRVENDLDALSADIQRLFGCLGDLRAGVAQALAEVANELNRIDADLGRWWKPTWETPATGTVLSGTTLPKYVGTTKYFDQPVNVWQTAEGTVTLPAVEPPAPDGNPLVNEVSNFTGYVQSNPAVKAAFGAAGASVQTLINEFGQNTIDASGTTVAQALNVLPPTATYANPGALTDALAAGNAAVIRATGIGDATIATSFTELGSGVQTVSSTPVDRLANLPAGAATALASAGIHTVGALATASPTTVQQALTRAGLSVSLADSASMTGTAKTLTSLR